MASRASKLRIDWALNLVMHRWGFNKKDRVGPTSEMIREAEPADLEAWVDHYRAHGRSDEELAAIGREMHRKIRRQVLEEVGSISEQDCIDYVRDLVLDKTFAGYQTEKETVAALMSKSLSVDILPASDKWDREYAVDRFIKLPGGVIGIQIKPVTYSQAPNAHQLQSEQDSKHRRFRQDVGGEVFTVIFGPISSSGKDRDILNPDVVVEIRNQVRRLSR